MDQDHCALAQGFGGEAANAYIKLGLLGHPGVDTHCGYGSPIHSPVSGTVCGVYTPEQPANDGYVAVFILVHTALEIFEYCIGHMSAVNVKVGDTVKKGDLLGKEGNKGYVFQDGQQITLAMQAAGDHRGSHRHNQKRPVKEEQYTVAAGHYLENWNGYVRTPSRGFYEWALPTNGYNSCVDYTLPLFNRDLQVGSSGYDVQLLQRALGVSETATFGILTENALTAFQQKHGIIPAHGICGPKTRAVLNSLYGQLEDPVGAQAGSVEDIQVELHQAADAIQTLPLAVQLPLWQTLLNIWKTLFTTKK